MKAREFREELKHDIKQVDIDMAHFNSIMSNKKMTFSEI